MSKKKSTICAIVMLFAILVSMMANTTVHAADPYWGAAYMGSGATETTAYVNVSTPVVRGTAKSWDFAPSSSATFWVTVYAPSNRNLGTIYFGTNTTQDGNLSDCTEKGSYRLEFHRSGSSSGGWVGCWLY